MNQLFYNIVGGIVHQIRREKRTTISEVIVRGKRIKQNGNWFYFNFSVESSSFKLNNFKTETFTLTFKGLSFVWFYQSVCCISPSDSEANRHGSDAESPFPLFFTLSASFKNSIPREQVGKLSSFWDRWAESLFVSIIVPKYNILPRANNGRSLEKTKNSGHHRYYRFAHAISVSVHYQDFDHAYVY